jgi:EAL domain-containing protein (putative c-di-GMP-specific phosphodiesterase class I)
LYDSANDRTCRDNLILLGQVPAAIANDEFIVWHQAKFALPSRQVRGTEALVRWRHPQRGLIMPGAFIPQAEETALINQLTYRIIDAALADMQRWTAGGRSMEIAINLSVQNLHDHELLDHLHEATLSRGLDPQHIEVEITESAVMSDFDLCRERIGHLRDRGYRVAIDDFGIGHSSLSYLRRLPVTTLKIDQTFIRHLATSDSDQKIVRSILGLARSFGLGTVAEGVEDEAALDLLRDWGCDAAQGFVLHRPAPCADLLQWLAERP